MKKRPFHDPDQPDGGRPVASEQTLADVAEVELAWRDIVQAQARLVGALARIDQRGDGPVAVGMPMDQAIAAARELSRVGRDLRAEVDASLADEPGWTGWSPDVITANVARLLDELRPIETFEREQKEAAQQWLAVQPHLDGQGFRYWGDAYGTDAALFAASLDQASDAPKAGVRRAQQRAEGLNRILRGWATGQHKPDAEAQADDARSRPAVTIHLLIEEAHASDGHAATVMTKTRGLAPRLTREALEALTAGNPDVTTITTYTRDGVPVSIDGRDGHAIDDPDGLSEDSTRELVRLRQGNVCAAPGCCNPVTDIHHIIWRDNDGPDDPSNRAGLCPACHHRIAHGNHGWDITVRDDGWVAWSRDGPTPATSTHLEPPRHRRILRRAAPRAPDGAPDDHPEHLDHDGDAIPF